MTAREALWWGIIALLAGMVAALVVALRPARGHEPYEQMSDWRSRAGGTGYSPEKKSSHATADYRQGTAERHCSICTMFVRAKGDGLHCRSVVDPIRVGGLCDYYKARK